MPSILIARRTAPLADYLVVNVSSPNTPGLRELQQGKMLDNLLERVMDARARMSREAGTTPVLIKIAPDLTLSELDDIVGAARRHRVPVVQPAVDGGGPDDVAAELERYFTMAAEAMRNRE